MNADNEEILILSQRWLAAHSNSCLIPNDSMVDDDVNALARAGGAAFFRFLSLCVDADSDDVNVALIFGPITVFLGFCRDAGKQLRTAWPTLENEAALFLEVDFDDEWPEDLQIFLESVQEKTNG